MTDVVPIAPRVLGGRYSLIERLGEGGFGAVYSAEDAELQRIVAVKLLDPTKATRTLEEAEQLGERFRREAVATAAITHRNVVTVFDIGVDGREIYIVMELLSGRALSEELERWPTGMGAERTLPLFVDALRGLAEGHAANIVHKDLKPENLFLADADGRAERICIIDFGVARLLHEQKLTATGKLVGTPRYFAPEYIEELHVSAALDVYQMGLILVELLCGMPCIPHRLDLVTCCQRHVDGELKIPAGLRAGAIGEVISRATQADPALRYPTAHEFAEALAAVDPESVHVETPGENRATPVLGVVPLKRSPTQPLHGGVAASVLDESQTARPQQATSRTAPTERLGPAESVAQQVESSPLLDPPPARQSAAGDVTMADADPVERPTSFMPPFARAIMAYVGSKVIHRPGSRARKVGSYTLVEMIGRGGMGEVWRAQHHMLSRPAAIKLVKTTEEGGASAEQIARFEREAELTTRLSHPNTITIFDYGRTAEGQFYYVMELLDGAALQTIVDVAGRQPPARVGHILLQILGALREAHGIGLIHRDIKPANIILCTQGGIPDVAKLLDFGLVKDVETEDDLKLTSDGTITGTPLYLAPESIKTPNLANARSDIYSLGAVAYFLLTGEHLFEANSLVELCVHHLHTIPTPPSERIGKELPADLERLVLDCLEKDPDDRPQSADEMIKRLTECRLEPWSDELIAEWWDEYGGALQPPDADPSDTVVVPLAARRSALYVLVALAFVAVAGTAALLTVEQRRSVAEDAPSAVRAPSEAQQISRRQVVDVETPKGSPVVAQPGPTVEATTSADAGGDGMAEPVPQLDEQPSAKPPEPEPREKKRAPAHPHEPEEMWILD